MRGSQAGGTIRPWGDRPSACRLDSNSFYVTGLCNRKLFLAREIDAPFDFRGGLNARDASRHFIHLILLKEGDRSPSVENGNSRLIDGCCCFPAKVALTQEISVAPGLVA
jgi:hypothetical protein